MYEGILKINKAIKDNLSGLPSFHKLVVYEALDYCDYKRGLIALPTLHEFSRDFYVERASGRKREIINEDTIRNAFRTIKKFKGDFFQFKTVNQRIEIFMPEVKALFDNSFASNNDAGVKSIQEERVESLEKTEDKRDFEISLIGVKVGENVEHFEPYKENINNKHNKQTSVDKKLPIADDFYPSAETIQTAQDRGFLKVTDKQEIASFIAYNKERETRWEDYNRVYLEWLSRCFTHKPKQAAQQVTGIKRKFTNEQPNTNKTKFNSGAALLKNVSDAWSRKINSSNSGRVLYGSAC